MLRLMKEKVPTQLPMFIIPNAWLCPFTKRFNMEKEQSQSSFEMSCMPARMKKKVTHKNKHCQLLDKKSNNQKDDSNLFTKGIHLRNNKT